MASECKHEKLEATRSQWAKMGIVTQYKMTHKGDFDVCYGHLTCHQCGTKKTVIKWMHVRCSDMWLDWDWSDDISESEAEDDSEDESEEGISNETDKCNDSFIFRNQKHAWKLEASTCLHKPLLEQLMPKWDEMVCRDELEMTVYKITYQGNHTIHHVRLTCPTCQAQLFAYKGYHERCSQWDWEWKWE